MITTLCWDYGPRVGGSLMVAPRSKKNGSRYIVSEAGLSFTRRWMVDSPGFMSMSMPDSTYPSIVRMWG